VPSIFFDKESAVSTAGNVHVAAFHHNPLPNDPAHRSASKEYFAPKGFGRLHCQVCSRYFINEQLLAQHTQSTTHQYKAAQLRGLQRPPCLFPPNYNILDCGEFDEAYHAMKSDSDDEQLKAPSADGERLHALKARARGEREQMQKINMEKTKFFEFVRTYQDREVSDTVQQVTCIYDMYIYIGE